MKVSLCATIYNSEDTAEEFVRSAVGLADEMVVVDGGSGDRTWPILTALSREYTQLTAARFGRWVSRGRGRQLAFDRSSGDIVLQLDANVAYRNLDKYVADYRARFPPSQLVNYGLVGRHRPDGETHFLIGTRAAWTAVGGYRDLYAYEDIDLARRAGPRYVESPIDLDDAIPLKVRGRTSWESDTKRYETSLPRRWLREMVSARDRIRVVGLRRAWPRPWESWIRR